MKPLNYKELSAYTAQLEGAVELIKQLNEALERAIKTDRKNKLEVLFAHTNLNCVPDEILDSISFRANGEEIFVYFDRDKIEVSNHRVRISEFPKFLTDNNISWENMF